MDSVKKKFLVDQLIDSVQIKAAYVNDPVQQELLHQISEVCTLAYKSGKKLLIAGNGGSAADAQHFAGELVSRFFFDRPALPAIALTTDSSILTAIGNDYGYDQLFARQIEAHGNEGDVFIGLSTSGNSPNILKGLHVAKSRGMITIGWTGQVGGKMLEICDHIIRVPSGSTPRIQEVHGLIGHCICAYIEREIFGDKSE
ncbi:D-sedoheptulose-7-phosphate isomerase [Undibacterium sp. Ji67W]|uniref:D-sedoheptulose-7-phosphate isomerase n=1 Tax=Undibacterium sp. Ji67W TaxID=3413042 RepID=UPI003BEFEF5C